MKRLKKKTVIRAFEKIGFKSHLDSENVFALVGNRNYSPCQWIDLWIGQEGEQIKTHDARWSKKPNIHIVGYWSYPRTLKDLNKIIEEIKETYSELCNTRFE